MTSESTSYERTNASLLHIPILSVSAISLRLSVVADEGILLPAEEIGSPVARTLVQVDALLVGMSRGVVLFPGFLVHFLLVEPEELHSIPQTSSYPEGLS